MPLTQLSSLRAELRDQRFRKVSLALALKLEVEREEEG